MRSTIATGLMCKPLSNNIPYERAPKNVVHLHRNNAFERPQLVRQMALYPHQQLWIRRTSWALLKPVTGAATGIFSTGVCPPPHERLFVNASAAVHFLSHRATINNIFTTAVPYLFRRWCPFFRTKSSSCALLWKPRDNCLI